MIKVVFMLAVMMRIKVMVKVTSREMIKVVFMLAVMMRIKVMVKVTSREMIKVVFMLAVMMRIKVDVMVRRVTSRRDDTEAEGSAHTPHSFPLQTEEKDAIEISR
ncbi:hypothetical protein AVEN_55168-1 [Araneus ventricosus]|uniref:Uncharacterized protein n=1 Tax=Araneus ventricosus TaxID=182803 RepID=A0A4Y2HLT0_ARAVE|nr:hypothetical protein AVEN_55168-1 [Araneus ventricosus]